MTDAHKFVDIGLQHIEDGNKMSQILDNINEHELKNAKDQITEHFKISNQDTFISTHMKLSANG
jgi:hypothetical protein